MTKQTSKLSKAIGQLIIGKIPGLDLDGDSMRALERGTMGGVTLFSENAGDAEQLMTLIDAIKKHCQYPGVIAVDQEGGAVQRLDGILTPLPSAMALAATENQQAIEAIANLSARQLSLLGINCNLAPTVDICSNPLNPVIATRSFSSNPSRVSDWGIAVTESFTRHHILAAAKHFPGHGATMEDSHLEFAVNPADSKTLWQRELVPYRKGIQSIKAVLTAHVWLPAIDEQKIPASLSNRVTTGLLREYLGFSGLVMTDDLTMKACASNFGIEQAAVLAILAGADQVLICGNLDEISAVHQELLKAVESGRICETRLNESLERIKLAYGSQEQDLNKSVAERSKALKNCLPDDRLLSYQNALSAISILRGESLNVSDGEWVVVSPDHKRYKLNLGSYLKQATNGRALNLSEKRYSLNPEPAEIESVSNFSRGKNCIFLTYRTLLNRGQIQLGRQLSEVTLKRVAIATDLPYDLIGLPSWDNCLATFDPSELSMEALSAVLTGHPARGTCPVSLQIEI